MKEDAAKLAGNLRKEYTALKRVINTFENIDDGEPVEHSMGDEAENILPVLARIDSFLENKGDYYPVALRKTFLDRRNANSIVPVLEVINIRANDLKRTLVITTTKLRVLRESIVKFGGVVGEFEKIASSKNNQTYTTVRNERLLGLVAMLRDIEYADAAFEEAWAEKSGEPTFPTQPKAEPINRPARPVRDIVDVDAFGYPRTLEKALADIQRMLQSRSIDELESAI